ncbi:MAG TPA: YraN family protein [Blastocatellia bacterium]|nr:YraN family protein [Blastocatellia bacterium]
MERVKSLLGRTKSNAQTAPHLALGQLGESLAKRYLRKHKYRIVVTNLKMRLGRGITGQPISGEIDIVAYDDNVLCFVEVKTRTSIEIAPPEAAVTMAKQRQIVRTAKRYRQMLGLIGEPFRYDVVSVVMTDPKSPEIELKRGYFSEENLRKRAFAWESEPHDSYW